MSCENITYESENNIYEFKNILIQHNGELQKLIKELELTKIRRLEDLTQDIKAETVVHNTAQMPRAVLLTSSMAALPETTLVTTGTRLAECEWCAGATIGLAETATTAETAAQAWIIAQCCIWCNTEEKLSTTKKELDHLVDLTHADLKSMGITRCSDRKAVLREAKKMNESFLNKQKTIDLC